MEKYTKGKFKANPYNPNNILIQSSDVTHIMKSLNMNDFKINDISLYQTSFVHNSYTKLLSYRDYDNDNNYLDLQVKSYEVMEFLGDAILESSICSYIYQRFGLIHDESEGFLSDLKARLVCGDMCFQLSKDLKFQKFLIISDHIEKSCDGRNNFKILKNVFESFIAAVFLDNDYYIANDFIIKVIEKFVDFTDILVKDNNYKGQIIRYCDKSFNGKPEFTTELLDNGLYSTIIKMKGEIISNATDEDKKICEKQASKNALIHFNVITE
jgi:ribonuclease-3